MTQYLNHKFRVVRRQIFKAVQIAVQHRGPVSMLPGSAINFGWEDVEHNVWTVGEATQKYDDEKKVWRCLTEAELITQAQTVCQKLYEMNRITETTIFEPSK